MAQQGNVEGRCAGRIGRQGRRCRGAHPPARLSGAGLRIGVSAQQQGSDAGLLGGQRKTPARSQIDQARRAARLDHHPAQSRAAQAVARRLEQGRWILGDREDQPTGIKPDLRETGGMESARLLSRLLPQPEDRPRPARRADRQQQREAGGAGRILSLICEHLMQPPISQPTAQPGIDNLRAEREQPIHAGARMAFQHSDMLLQQRKSGQRLRHLVPYMFYGQLR